MKDSEKTMLYCRLFNTPEADMVLCDLMDRFFEFRPVKSDYEAGAQSVIIYIKNRLLGISEPDPVQLGEQ